MLVPIVARPDWSGQSVKMELRWPVRPATKVFFQNTSSSPCPNDFFCRASLRLLQAEYFKKFNNDIKYNFLIGGDGTVYEGRGWLVCPFLPKEYADDVNKSINIAFIGWFTKNNLPEVMNTSAMNLINDGIQYGLVSKVYEEYDLMLGHPKYLRRAEMTFNIVTRDMWGSMPEEYVMPVKTPVYNVVVMSVMTPSCNDLWSCRESLWQAQVHNRQSQGLDDIRYNFMVSEDGTVYEGRGWAVQPTLPPSHKQLNVKCVLIGCIGNFTAINQPEKMSTAAQLLVEYGIKEKYISETFYYHDIRKYTTPLPGEIYAEPV